MVSEVVILGAARTPIGAFLGALSTVPAPKLGAIAIRAALERAKVSEDRVDELFFGNVIQAGVGMAPARQAALAAGLPIGVPCTTINKVCGSGLKAVMLAVSQIRAGEGSLIVAGGMESMSNAPHLVRGMRTGVVFGDQKLEDANLSDGLFEPQAQQHVGYCSEQAVELCGLTRADLDAFALQSYERALAAQRSGAFQAEIVPVEAPGPKGATKTIALDETPRETSLDALAKLRPTFKEGGTLTPGNASKINDGAAALVLADDGRARELGAQPIARVVAQAQHAREPELFLLAPSEAIRKVVKRAGWAIGDVDLFEVNEAYSAIEGVRREVGIPSERFNVNGGAVALGHPLGASGARILVTLLYALRARGGTRGVASLCLGGGEAVALAVELL